jgi:hypothetical protein
MELATPEADRRLLLLHRWQLNLRLTRESCLWGSRAQPVYSFQAALGTDKADKASTFVSQSVRVVRPFSQTLSAACHQYQSLARLAASRAELATRNSLRSQRCFAVKLGNKIFQQCSRVTSMTAYIHTVPSVAQNSRPASLAWLASIPPHP